MRIDNAIQVFSEKYDREAFQFIDEISCQRGMILNGTTVKAFNLKESFDMFSQYLKEYAGYKVKNIGNEKASPQDVIKESVNQFINTEIFKESNVKYSDLPKFIMSYIEGVNGLQTSIEESKRLMQDSEADQESIGDVNEFADRFMEKFHESFDPFMEKALLASGYTAKKKLSSFKSQKKPVFL